MTDPKDRTDERQVEQEPTAATDCAGYEADLAALVDGELEVDRAVAVSAHAAACPRCGRALEELRRLGQRLQDWSPEAPDAAWTERAAAAVRQRAAAAGGGGGFFGWLLRPGRLAAAGAVVVLLVAGVWLGGDTLRSLFANSANALPGDSSVIPELAERPDERLDPSQVYGHRNMKTFGQPGGSAGGDAPAARHGVLRSQPAAPADSAPSARPRPDAWQQLPERNPSFDPEAPADRADEEPAYRASGSQGPPPGFADHPPSPPLGATADKNSWYASNYRAGAGERERLAKLVEAGVVVDGEKLELGALTRAYTQHLEVPGDRALALSAAPDRGRIPSAGGEVFLQVAIRAAERELARRPPLNLALVIDRSGSMGADGKMDAAKRAARRLIRAARPDDRLVVIAYDHHVERAGGADADRQALLGFVDGLYPRGSTDIHGALDAAYRALADGSRPEALDALMLLSDGMPTAGVTEPAAIAGLAATAAEHGIATTTIGVGLDYNDALMMDLAGRGQGRYHFVKDAASIERILRQEFEDLERVVARALRLRIVLDDDVVLRRVLGSRALDQRQTAAVRAEERHIDRKLYRELGIAPDRQRDADEGIRMLIPHFFSGDAHVVLLQLWVPPGSAPRRLARVELRYKDLLQRRNGHERARARVGYSDDPDAVARAISRPVKKNLLGFRAGEALLRAAELVEAGRADRAAAMVAEQARLFRAASSAWSDAQLERDAALLERYLSVLGRLGDPALAGRERLRAYLAKTMARSGYGLVQ
jgi:Ca-activated chloride channel family protein